MVWDKEVVEVAAAEAQTSLLRVVLLLVLCASAAGTAAKGVRAGMVFQVALREVAERLAVAVEAEPAMPILVVSLEAEAVVVVAMPS